MSRDMRLRMAGRSKFKNQTCGNLDCVLSISNMSFYSIYLSTIFVVIFLSQEKQYRELLVLFISVYLYIRSRKYSCIYCYLMDH